ncbi:Tail-specific protease precursor [Roseimaritima multifibrata]|uniref:Tail-specific protease n=1 Tax=Roseimaritima multifibrata TaxID=1930274 RepID=A0A517MFP8_9BACT|nr:carboxy terminal-processing peptidase [Roseimaritima multifibrata]QDS93715.1 Tail-specific protease precursor [Roseimaritima multifibrata]
MPLPAGRFGFRILLVALAVLTTVGAMPRFAAADEPAPTENDRRVSIIVSTLLPRRHLSRRELDDSASQRALGLFIKALDPLKLYFYQSDFDEFSAYQTTLDDSVKKGDLTTTYKIFNRFLERVDERVAVVDKLLSEPFDFSRQEMLVTDPDAARYPLNADEATDRWRKQLKYNLLDLKDEGKEGEEAIEQLRRRYQRYARRWHQTESDDVLELFLTSITSSYDPHTTYMSPSSLDDFEMLMRLSLDGIGAALREKDGYTVVTNVIPGGAADKHGKLKEDDYVVSVGQGKEGEGEMVDIVEMPLKQVVQMIRGAAGTTVRLGVKPGGVGDVLTYEIVRAKVQLEDSAARGQVIEHEMEEGGKKMKIGYINLPSFYMDMEAARQNRPDYRSSTRDVRRLLDGFRDENVECVVLDLSKNGGGSLTEAISLTGLFIDQGTVVQVKNSDGSVDQYDDEEAGVAWDGPLVVMTSQFSASASEILAGAIKDYRRGLIVGDEKTHGKGTVQTLMDLARELLGTNRENFGALKVTLQQFYLPDGDSTQKAGVAADVILPSLTTHMDVGEDDLEYALEHDRVPRSNHRIYNMVPADVLGQVRAQSADRIAKNEEFTKLQRQIDSYRKQKDEQFISLDEEQFFARRKELNADKEDIEAEVEQQSPDDEVFTKTYYNDEVLNIAQDYATDLQRQNLASAK